MHLGLNGFSGRAAVLLADAENVAHAEARLEEQR